MRSVLLLLVTLFAPLFAANVDIDLSGPDASVVGRVYTTTLPTSPSTDTIRFTTGGKTRKVEMYTETVQWERARSGDATRSPIAGGRTDTQKIPQSGAGTIDHTVAASSGTPVLFIRVLE